MNKVFFSIRFLLLFLALLILPVNGQTTRSETWEGKLVVGEEDSAIIYYGSESGDLAAFCFANNSAAGRAILAKCKHGEQCKFSGKISSVGNLCHTANEYVNRLKMGGYSFTGQIVSLNWVRKIKRK